MAQYSPGFRIQHYYSYEAETFVDFNDEVLCTFIYDPHNTNIVAHVEDIIYNVLPMFKDWRSFVDNHLLTVKNKCLELAKTKGYDKDLCHQIELKEING